MPGLGVLYLLPRESFALELRMRTRELDEVVRQSPWRRTDIDHTYPGASGMCPAQEPLTTYRKTEICCKELTEMHTCVTHHNPYSASEQVSVGYLSSSLCRLVELAKDLLILMLFVCEGVVRNIQTPPLTLQNSKHLPHPDFPPLAYYFPP